MSPFVWYSAAQAGWAKAKRPAQLAGLLPYSFNQVLSWQARAQGTKKKIRVCDMEPAHAAGLQQNQAAQQHHRCQAETCFVAMWLMWLPRKAQQLPMQVLTQAQVADNHGQQVRVLALQRWHLVNGVLIHVIQDTRPEQSQGRQARGASKGGEAVYCTHVVQSSWFTSNTDSAWHCPP